MLYETITFTVPGAPGPARLVSYVPDNSPEIDKDRRRPAVIVCPGGGYHFLSDREAEPIALRLMALGFNAFVLYYHVAPARYPVPQLEAAWAVSHVKKNAQALLTDARRVFIAGFSAGGHVAASLGILWNQEPWARRLGVSAEEVRPSGMVLSYPVITSGPYAHQGSFDQLLGEERQGMNEAVSLEKRVAGDAVPAFLWHTWEDASVPVENSLLLATALRKHGVPFELHVYPSGVHGLSLSSDQVYGPDKAGRIRPECQEWIDLAARWMKR